MARATLTNWSGVLMGAVVFALSVGTAGILPALAAAVFIGYNGRALTGRVIGG